QGITLGVTRIGAHAGPAIVGNFGGGHFFDYTAYGDTINIAARLEAANKRLGTRHHIFRYLDFQFREPSRRTCFEKQAAVNVPISRDSGRRRPDVLRT